MRNIAIIPARSGSKGLLNKNIMCLCGKPLICYTIEAAIESKCFETIMVSTDSAEYGRIAQEHGAEVPFYRSSINSTDNAGSWDVVLEVLNRYAEVGETYDSVCLLQPTSPLRKADEIIQGYSMLMEKGADAITSVCEVEYPNSLCLELPPDGSLKKYRNSFGDYLPRQTQIKYHRINGAIYIRRIKYECDRIVIQDGSEFAMIMERKHSIDIDEPIDMWMAEMLLKRELKNLD